MAGVAGQAVHAVAALEIVIAEISPEQVAIRVAEQEVVEAGAADDIIARIAMGDQKVAIPVDSVG